MNWRKLMTRRLKRVLIGLIIFFAVYTLFGFFGLPPIAKFVLTKKLSEALHRQVTIQQIKTNPYALSLIVRGFLVQGREGSDKFVSFDELYVNLQSVSLFKGALVLKEIRLKEPYLNIKRNEDSSYNFSDLLENKEPKTVQTSAEKPKPLRFSLNNIRIENGSIDFWDGPEKTKHTVRELNIGIPFISNIPSNINVFVQPNFSAMINGSPYEIHGETKPFADSRQTSLDINIKDLNIPYYLAYLPMKLKFKISSAYLDTEAKISFIEYKDKEPSLTVSGNAFLKKVALNDEKKNPLFRLPLLEIGIAPSEPLKKAFHLSKISIQSPELNVQRNPNGTLNIESLLPEKKGTQPASKPQEKKEETALSIDVDEVQLMGGNVSFSDLSTKKPFKTILTPIELKVDHFSNGKDKKTAYTLFITSEAKEHINLKGELSVEPLWTEGGLEIKSVPLKKYSPYYQDQILFNLEEGRLNFFTRYKYAKGGKEPEISLSELSVILNSLRLRRPDEEEDFLNIPVISVKDSFVDVTQKKLTVGSFSTEKGMLAIKRLKNGEIDIQKIFRSSPPKEALSPEPVRKVETQGRKEQVPGEERAGKTEKPWLLRVENVSLDQYHIMLQDLTPGQPVSIEGEAIQLRAKNLSTAKNSKGQLSLSLILNKNGNISISGDAGVDPLFADLKATFKDIDILPYQPYFADQVNIILTGGWLSATGNLQLKGETGKDTQIIYKGDSSLNNLASIDKVDSEDFLKWESLALSNMDVGINPFHVNIEGIALTHYYARVIIDPNGVVNLQEIIVKKESETSKGVEEKSSPKLDENKPAPAEKESPRNIKIEKVTLQGGTINYSDHFIKPNVTVNMTDVGGRISGLSSEEATAADVELHGKFGEQASPVEIIGKINPLEKNLYVDLKVSFKDIELSPWSPYSGKYAGYDIEKGKLSLDLKYLIENRKLDAQNRIFVDQFTFGEKVDSPSATKLPVKFAVALLKNREGNIDLNIPVSGSLDDPKFSVFSIILKVIVNLLEKAATSPFALLGAAFGGGGEHLEYMEFDYGSAEIKGENVTKLNTLIKVLHGRPSLELDIGGYVDPEKDKEALKQLFFMRKLRAQKLKEMLKKGEPAVPVDEVKIEPQEYEKYLKLAYKGEKFPKPENFLGMAKNIPGPEMEKLMLTYTEVKDEDLRTLASQRAMNVDNAILKSKEVEAERVFVAQPKTLAPPKRDDLKESRVEFKLK
jgi:uncharacterized protein involved in outer membrane biogenesis